MGKIIILEPSLANMIAAGEVIERPSSVVKELVENSIDAKAHHIKVMIQKAGRESIVVEDDGIGMDREDAVNALKRHATSKISSEFDLFRIKTLGFRGEALPSISAVSRLRIFTSNGTTIGTELLAQSDSIKIIDASQRQGTIVSVEELFYNTPARLKYLKSDFIENSATTETLSRIALAHPEVSFSYYIDSKKQFETTGRGELLETIMNVYGMEAARNMVPFIYQSNDFSILGFVGKPEIAKSNRYYMVTLLNGRNVFMPKVQTALIEAYRDFLPPSRFPFVVLSFTSDPALVDVNVHPSKREVRFSKEESLRLVLLEKIPFVLKSQSLASTPTLTSIKTNQTSEESLDLFSSINNDLKIKEPDATYLEHVEQPDTEIHPLKNLKAIAQLQLTYILAEDMDGGFYLIDQHAAAERTNYEKYKSLNNQQLIVLEPLIPIILEYKTSELLLLTKEKFQLLESIGIRLESFGGNSFKVVQLPSWARQYNEKEYVEEMIEEVIHDDRLDPIKFREHAIATFSCKRSIKANDRLDIVSMQYILDQLLKCQNPYSCPHGRPTIVHFTRYQLEKLFNRTGF